MTHDEMVAVVRGAMKADGECVYCAGTVITDIAAALPALPWQAVWLEVVNGEYGYETVAFNHD